LLDDSFEDWSAWMPFDRIALATRSSEAVPSSADRVTATETGWSIEMPLRGRTISADLGSSDGEAIRRGRRARPWVCNVLALGDAATCLDPLHGFHLELVHQAIFLALELLPGRDFPDVETNEYNRRAELITRRVRDFVAAHYLLGPWKSVAGMEPPDSLARTLDQFAYRGRIPFHEDEIVSRDSWTAALLGLGIIPRNVDPQAAAIPIEQVIPAIERLAAEIDRFAASAPTYADYLARMMC
jgi:tryptophan halogenase